MLTWVGKTQASELGPGVCTSMLQLEGKCKELGGVRGRCTDCMPEMLAPRLSTAPRACGQGGDCSASASAAGWRGPAISLVGLLWSRAGQVAGRVCTGVLWGPEVVVGF